MPPKAAGAKKKIVKTVRTVRKTRTPTRKTPIPEPSLSEQEEEAAPLPETLVTEAPPPESSLPETAVTETLASETSHPETAVTETLASETTLPETAVTETLASEISLPETAVTETLASETSLPETAVTETPHPETTSQATVTETPPPDVEANDLPGTAPESADVEPSEAPETAPKTDEAAAKPRVKRTIIRVVKVKKKVLVKRATKVPETSPKEEKGEESSVPITAAAAAEEEEHRKPNPNPNPNQLSEVTNLDSNAANEEAPPEEVVAGEAGNLETEDGGTGKNVPAEEAVGGDGGPDDEERQISERQKRRKTEIFIGGLDRDSKEEDIKKVFGKVGEIVEVRMMMDGQSGKNKGYAFLRYATAAQAKQAVTEFVKVEVCGKLCGAAALEGNDTIFLGNIDKSWKKEDVVKLLQDIEIEKIDTVTVMPDPNNTETNRGFAFLELETNRDAQIAFKKLQKKDVFGKGRNIKVAWAEPLNDPDEDEMQKVKSVYAEGIPSSWDEEKVKQCFKKFGKIERVVLARNIQSAKRKDFAFVNYTTREAALSCIKLFDKENLIENGSKINLKVSLAKPVHKGKQNKGGSKSASKDYSKEKPKAVQLDTKVNVTPNKGQYVKSVHSGDKTSSTTRELLHVLREQAAWKQGQTVHSRGPASQDYTSVLQGGKRPFSAVGDGYSDLRGYPRARTDNSYPIASPSYSSLSQSMAGTSLPYYQRPSVGYATGAPHGAPDPSSTLQTRHEGAPYGNSYYPRY